MDTALALLGYLVLFVAVPLVCMAADAGVRWVWARRPWARRAEVPDWAEVERWLDEAA